jgi:hypothetical protein
VSVDVAANKSTMCGMPKGLLPSLGICILIVTLSLPGTVHGGNTDVPAPRSSVTLAWDKSRDRTVKGYRLHYGVTSGRNYFHVLDVGKATSCKLSDLIPGKKYYFVVTSYSASGKESLPSKEKIQGGQLATSSVTSRILERTP